MIWKTLLEGYFLINFEILGKKRGLSVVFRLIINSHLDQENGCMCVCAFIKMLSTLRIEKEKKCAYTHKWNKTVNAFNYKHLKYWISKYLQADDYFISDHVFFPFAFHFAFFSAPHRKSRESIFDLRNYYLYTLV